MPESVQLKFGSYDPVGVEALDPQAWLLGALCLRRYSCGDNITTLRLQSALKKWMSSLGQRVRGQEHRLKIEGATASFEPDEMVIIKDAIAQARVARGQMGAAVISGDQVDALVHLDQIIADGEQKAREKATRDKKRGK